MVTLQLHVRLRAHARCGDLTHARVAAGIDATGVLTCWLARSTVGWALPPSLGSHVKASRWAVILPSAPLWGRDWSGWAESGLDPAG